MRFTASVLLVLIATLVAPLVIATGWLNHAVEDRQEYVETVAPLAKEPRVREVLANASADAAVAALQKHVPVGLPEAVDQWALVAANTVVESPDFPEFWRTANRDLHRQIIDLLEDPDATPDGRLSVDASPLLAQVLLLLEERGIPVGLLPKVRLDVPIVSQANVVEAGPSYRSAQKVTRLLPLLWAGLVVLAILIAAGWRGRVRIAGLALIGVGVAAGLVRLATDPLSEFVIDRASASQQDLTRILLDALTGSLSPYAGRYLYALPVGVLLFAFSLWPRSRKQSPVDDRFHDAHQTAPNY